MDFITCVKCQERKSVSEFYTRKRKLADGSTKTYPRKDCKKCSSKRYALWVEKKENKKSRREVQRLWVKNNPDKCENARLKYRYGVTLDEYNEMLSVQERKCGICSVHIDEYAEKISTKFHVDHCHETKKVRGLLCNNCNVSLGGFKDSIEILEAAIKYLTEPPAHATLRLNTAGDKDTQKEPPCLLG